MKSILRAAPQITAKSPPNAPEAQEIAGKLSGMNYFIALQYILEQFKISYIFLYMTFPTAWATFGIQCDICIVWLG